MSSTFNGRSYSLSLLSGTDGRDYARPPLVGSEATLWDQFFADVLAEMTTAATIQSVSPGAAGGYARSNGAAWVRVNSSQIKTDILPADAAGVLQNNGSGTLSWAAAPTDTNGWKLLSAVAASAASSVDFTQINTSLYTHYAIKMNGVFAPSSGTLWMRLSQDGGSSFKSGGSDYRYNYQQMSDTSGFGATATSATAAQMVLTTKSGNSATRSHSGEIMLAFPGGANGYCNFYADLAGPVDVSTSVPWRSLAQGAYIADETAINAIRILAASGTITGRFALFGLQKS